MGEVIFFHFCDVLFVSRVNLCRLVIYVGFIFSPADYPSPLKTTLCSVRQGDQTLVSLVCMGEFSERDIIEFGVFVSVMDQLRVSGI